MNTKDPTEQSAQEIIDRLAKFLADPNRRGALKSAKIALRTAQAFPKAAMRAGAMLEYAHRTVAQDQTGMPAENQRKTLC